MTTGNNALTHGYTMKADDRVRFRSRAEYRRESWPEGVWLRDGEWYAGTIVSVHPDPAPGPDEPPGYAVLALDHGATVAVDWPEDENVEPIAERDTP